jgi:hypothetical protein
VGKLKTDQATYKWFRVSDRPVRPADQLGPYKLMPLDSLTTLPGLSEDQQGNLQRYLSLDMATWDRVGSVTLGCFDWWYTQGYSGRRDDLQGKTIGDVVCAEFDMYRAHLRKVNGKDNFGWLRNMYYGLCQQAMRQDPVYYLVYYALRPDRNVNLVSYPYYAKYQVPGDQTFFRHIDLNIQEWEHLGRGANMIQGMLSLDDEHDDDCTMILPGMRGNHTST